MAARDKEQEFFTSFRRFSFLAECYRDENLPQHINEALDEIVLFYNSDDSFKKKCEEADDYFDSFHEQTMKYKRRELIDYLLKEMTND